MGRLNSDQVHVAKLRDLLAAEGALPRSLPQMARALGFKSANAALKLRDRLCAQGILRKDPDGKVLPAEPFFALPLMETSVRAGFPQEIGPQMWAETLTLENFLVKHPSRTVLLKVKGDSMRDAGILDGDLAVIERTQHAHAGQFVVAIVDDAYTLKELRFQSGQPVLVPHNAAFKPIRPEGRLEIFGVLRGLARSHWPARA